MANDFRDSKGGARPGMSADEAAKRLRTREQNLGEQGSSDENSAIGWTEEQPGETLQEQRQSGAATSEQGESQAPVEPPAAEARGPALSASTAAPLPTQTVADAPVAAEPEGSPSPSAHGMSAQQQTPERVGTASGTGLTAGLPVEGLVPVAQGGTRMASLHAGGDGTTPLQVSGDVNAELIEDDRQSAVGRLIASGGQPGVPAGWQVVAPDGVYGRLSVDAGGNWRYELNNGSTLVQSLNEGEHVSEAFLLRVTAGHVPPQDLLIQVDVRGTNDRPEILATSSLTGSVQEDLHTSASGWLLAGDVDKGDQLHWSVDTLRGLYGDLNFDTASGHWQYTLDNNRALTQSLAQGQVAGESFLATVTDGHAASANTRIDIVIAGSNDAPVIAQLHTAQATEDGVVVLGRVPATDVDQLDHLSFSTSVQVPGFTLHSDGGYSFDPSDSAYQHLGEGEVQQLIIPVTVSDDHGATDTRNLTLVLTGSNDLPVLNTLAARSAVEQGAQLHGQLAASDVDSGDVLTFSTPAHVEGFVLNGDGSYSFDPSDPAYESLPEGALRVLTIPVTVTDNHGGIAMQNLLINLTGTNQGAVIGGVSSGTVVEDQLPPGAGLLVTGGQLSILDPDAGESAFVAHQGAGVLQGSCGTLSIDAQGHWQYQADNSQPGVQQLGQGETLTEHFIVSSLDGTPHAIDITLVGNNDVPVVGGSSVTRGALVEDALPGSISGQLQAVDADASSQLAWSLLPSASRYGALDLDPVSGVWTYTLDNTRPATQELAQGQQVIERFTALVSDEHGATARQDIVVTVTGSNDSPLLKQVPVQYLSENGVAVHGQLLAHDVDRGDTLVYGTSAQVPGFILSVDGSWSFDPANAAYEHLPAGATQVLSIPLNVTDNQGGSGTQILTVVITGTNQGALITGIDSGQVTEDVLSAGSHMLATGGSLSIADPDSGEALFNPQLAGNALVGAYGTLSIDAAGNWRYQADNGQLAIQRLAQGSSVVDHFTVTSVDGTPHQINVTLHGSNDTPQLSAISMRYALEDGPRVLGQLQGSDVDSGDTLNYATQANVPGFTLHSDGSYSFDPSDAAYQHLAAGASQLISIPVTLTDSLGASSTQNLLITLTGSNDLPVMSLLTPRSASEGDAPLGGRAQASDIDLGDVLHYTATTQVPGFSIDSDGTWRFNPDNLAYRSLPEGAIQVLSIPLQVSDGQGGSATQNLLITLVGRNQGAVIGGVDTAQLTEDQTASGSHRLEAAGQLVIDDPDSGEAMFVAHSGSGALRGSYGTLSIDASGVWHYSADNQQSAVQSLNQGQVVQDVFSVTSADGTAHQICVTLQGVNDAPVISQVSVVSGGVQEDAPRTSVIGQVLASDVDSSAHLTWSLASGAGIYGTLALDADTGVWAYTLDNDRAPTQGLLGGQQVHETFLVTVSDGLGGTAQRQVEITITGSNDLPVISGTSSGAVHEDAPTHSVSGTLAAQDIDSSDSLHWSVVNGDGTYGHLSIDPLSGRWIYSLDNARPATNALPAGARVQDSFVVQATDSSGQPVSQRVTIDIAGSNDLPVIGGSHQASLTEDAARHVASGTLTHSDPDSGDTFHWSTVGSNQGQYGDFSFDLGSGKWSYNLDNARPATDALGKGQLVQEVFHLAGTDSSGAPVYQDIVIRITGSNDLPVISGSSRGTVTEDATAHMATGVLTHQDPDSGDHFSWSLLSGQGTYGTLSFDTTSGAWLYNLDNSRAATQALAEGEQHIEQFTVRGQDASGTPVLQVIAVQVNGSNDNPLIGGVHQGSVVEDLSMTASGALSFSDVDKDDVLGGWQVRVPQGNYGTLAIDDQGNWTYHLDAALSQSIRAGDTVQDSFTVRVSDNHAGYADQQVTLLITGTNDAPAIDPRSPALSGEVTEDKAGATRTEGSIPSGDPDIGDTQHWQIKGGDHSGTFEGRYGTLSLDQNGHWTYTLDHARADSLAEGQTATERFPVSVTDAAGQRSSAYIQVQVLGSNDAPHIGGASTGAVTEDVATSTSGRLLSGDVDSLDSARWEVLGDARGQFGSLSVDAHGVWSYHLDSGSARLQAMGDNDSATEVFRVRVSDPHGASDIREVSILVHGHNDAPFVTGVDTGKVIEDSVLRVSGQLVAQDADHNDQPVFQHAQYAGTYGQFVMVPDGHWSYELFPGAHAQVQTLGEGQTASETFTVAAVDQHGGIIYRPVTVTVHGSNDAPVISGASTGVAMMGLNETASGRLIGNDIDQTDSTTWHLLDGQGQYGSLTLDVLGRWAYTLDPTDADTQSLRPGDQVTDTFRVQLTDDKGSMAEQLVTVTVVGTETSAINPSTQGGGNGGGSPVITLPAVSVMTTEDVSTVRSGLLQGALPNTAITWQVTPATGAFGQLSLGANGEWLYTLNNDAPQVQALNQGQTVQEHFTAHGTDAAGNTIETSFSVTINGTDDLPHIVGVDTGSAIEDQQIDVHGALAVQDPDMGDVATWRVQQPQGALGSFSIDANGDWQYQLDNAKAQHLNAGDALIERFLVVAEDGHGGSETHEVTVTVHGTADAPIIPSVIQGTAKPGAGETLSGQVLAHDADAGDTLSFTLLSQPHGQYGTLSFDQDGNWQYQLDPASSNSTLRALAEGEQAVDSFTVQVRDNAGNVAQQQIQLQISGSNDAPQIGGATSGVVMDQTSVQASGQLSISDPDSGDRALITAQSLDGAHGHFQVDDSGHWTYRLDSHDPAVRALNEGESLTETFHVIATDQSGAQSGRDVVVTIHGSNDTPVVTGDTDGSTQEDGNSLAQGTLTVSDPDTGDSTEWVGMNTASAYGHFQMSSDGVWVYRLNDNAPQVQALQDGQVITETFTAHGSDKHGAELTQIISIEVHGQNDTAIITGQRTGDISEDEQVLGGKLVVSGQVHVSDVDSGEGLLSAQTLSGTYGTLELASNGTWRYSADNQQDAIQQLGAGQTLVEHINLRTADGTPYQISVTIHGSNDAPLLTALSVQTADEDGPLITGQLQGSDIDSGDTLAYSTTATVAGFTLNTDGSYSFDPADPAWQHLAEGSRQVLDIPMSVTDSLGSSATQHLKITLTGTNDLPVLSVQSPPPLNDGSQPITGHAHASDVDSGDVLTYSTSVQVEGFSVDADGTWHFDPGHPAYLQLPEGATQSLSIPLTVSDNHGGSVTQNLLITLTGTNQSAVITGVDTGSVNEDQGVSGGLLETSGQLAISDPDSNEAAFAAQTLSGRYGVFTIDTDGAWHYRADNAQAAIQSLGEGASLSEPFQIHSVDGTAHSITVTLTGSNDLPLMSVLTELAASEGDAVINGQASASDVDANTSLTFSTASLVPGFSIDADGSYSFDPSDPAYQHLPAGTSEVLSIPLIVTDEHGGMASQQLLITLTGSNEGAVVSGVDQGDVTANQTAAGGFLLETGGQLDVSDADSGEAQFIPQDTIGGAYGTLSIDASGAWHYSADNDQQVIQQLGQGESLTDSFVVSTLDGTEHPIVVTVTSEGAVPAPQPEEQTATSANGSADGEIESSPVDPYLQFIHQEPAYGGEAQVEEQSFTPSSDDSVAASASPLDDYLQHAGIDPAHFSPPDPLHEGGSSADNPFLSGTEVQDAQARVEGDGSVAPDTMLPPEPDPQSHH